MKNVFIATYVASITNQLAAEQYLDRQKLHQNICNACGDMQRSKSHTLYYLLADPGKDLFILTVQSACKPADIPGFLRVGTVEQHISNDVSFVEMSLVPAYSLNGKKHYLTSADHRRRWVETQAKKHGFEILNLTESPKRIVYFRHKEDKGGSGSISYYDYACRIKVTDPILFKEACINGVGNGKNYGLGLIRQDVIYGK